MQVAYDSSANLAVALRSAAAAHGKHEQEIGHPDPDWPDWYAQYMVDEQGGSAMAHATTDLSRRTPQQLLAHHGQAMRAEDLDAIQQEFAETACVITSDSVTRGKDDIRAFFARFFQMLPHAQWTFTSKATFADNFVLLEWTADSAQGSVSDGVDTFVFQNGLIQCETIHFTVVPKP